MYLGETKKSNKKHKRTFKKEVHAPRKSTREVEKENITKGERNSLGKAR